MNSETPSAIPGDKTGFAYRWLMRFPRLLLAEDDDDLRAVLAAMFHGDGFEVFAVQNGNDLAAALEWAHEQREPPFDLVLTDLRMPGRNPLEVIRAMRREGLSTPAIVMTAFDDPELRNLVAQFQFTTLVGKPFNINELENAVVVSIGRAP